VCIGTVASSSSPSFVIAPGAPPLHEEERIIIQHLQFNRYPCFFLYLKKATLMDESSDFEKLQKALSTLTGHFASFEEILHAFGLANMPAAQRYGIMFGFLVFTLTITAVVTLLVLGGSFARIAQQAKTGDVVVSDPVASRSERPLLFERLLEARERMMRENYPEPERTSGRTNLMKMLLNLPIKIRDTSELANDDAAKTKNDGSIPPGYQDDYVEAYRKCQEKPGGEKIYHVYLLR
jgi:hypothetical protein